MRKKKAFTIIEILITMIIMGTISATVIPRIGDINEMRDETVKKINDTRDFACDELGLDDMCVDGSSSFNKDSSDGVHYSERAGEIKVCKDKKCITMMDGDVSGLPNIQYQRGNGYSFSRCNENGCYEFTKKYDVGPGDSNGQIDCSSYSPGNPFIDNHFVGYYNDYCENSNDNLRGGEGDSSSNYWGYDTENMVATNVTGRKGPCPNGYHIPSKGEWMTLVNMYYGTNTNGESTSQVEDFQKAFKLSTYGYRDINAVTAGIGDTVALRSSSPSGNGNARSFVVNLSSNKSVSANVSNPRASALSVRCFKNHTEVKKVEEIKEIDGDLKKSDLGGSERKK